MGKQDGPQLQVNIVNRRSEERTPATGEVIVRSGETVMYGEVADVSRSGFRIRYRGEPVDLGPEPDVVYPWGHVKANPVWFRRAGEWVEVGFRITEKVSELPSEGILMAAPGAQTTQKPQHFLTNRRREERTPASGEATLRFAGGERTIVAEMVDVSPNGFRVRYRGAPLKTGLRMQITYPWGDVKAVVVWGRVVGEWYDVGFLITTN